MQSWRQFQAYFGDFTGAGYLAYAVRAFFENGGQRCWVVRVASETAATAALTLQSESLANVWDGFSIEPRSVGQRSGYRDQGNAPSADR